MLWYKTWLETRARFLIGLFLLLTSAAGILLNRAYDPLDYRSYIWSQWFGFSLLQGWCLFAVILGVGGLTRETSRGSALLTLSLPASRNRLLAVRTAVVAAELFLLALLPSLLIFALSPMTGRVYPLGDTLVHVALMAAGGMALLGLSTWLSALFTSFWKPLVIAFAIEAVLDIITYDGPGSRFPANTAMASHFYWSHVRRYNLNAAMVGYSYFSHGTLPWAGLAINLAIALALFYASARILARRDF